MSNTKVFTDFLLSQEDIILNYPIPCIIILVIGFALGWSFNSWSQKTRIETNEERLKANEERLKGNEDKIKEKDAKIQSLEEEKLAFQGQLKENDNSLSLNDNEIRALKAISRFQKEHPCQESEVPTEYSVDTLVKDLQIDWGEANEILKKLRRLGLFESIWDNTLQFTNLARPINETQPGRLSKTGQEFLRNYRSGD